MNAETQTKERSIRNTAGIVPAAYADMSIIDLLDEQRCYLELLTRLHPDGCFCRCGVREAIGHGRTRAGFPVFRCQGCGSTYTILSGTPFSGTKLDAVRIVLFMRMWANGDRADKIGKEIGLHKNSVQMLITKLTVYGRYKGEEN